MSAEPPASKPLKVPRTKDIGGQFVLLGTGTSVGVPVIGCDCDVCQSGNPRNHRTRCAAVVGLPEGNLLIDTPPDLRQQLLREQVGMVHAVIYTHEHADHLFGLDDVRLFPFFLGHPIPMYCEPLVDERIRRTFDYAFADHEPTHPGSAPQLDMRTIDERPLEILGQRIIPLRLRHGPRFDVLGFRIGDVAYCTDTNEVPPETVERLQGLDVLILDALRRKPHPTHYCLDAAIEMAQRIGARRTVFTHISHDLEHEQVNAELPPGIELAYDGQRFALRFG